MEDHRWYGEHKDLKECLGQDFMVFMVSNGLKFFAIVFQSILIQLGIARIWCLALAREPQSVLERRSACAPPLQSKRPSIEEVDRLVF